MGLFNVLEITHNDHNYRYLVVLDFITKDEFTTNRHGAGHVTKAVHLILELGSRLTFDL